MSEFTSIDVIKAIREKTGSGLREAKEAFDELNAMKVINLKPVKAFIEHKGVRILSFVCISCECENDVSDIKASIRKKPKAHAHEAKD